MVLESTVIFSSLPFSVRPRWPRRSVGRDDALVVGEQVVGVLVEVADAADHRAAPATKWSQSATSSFMRAGSLAVALDGTEARVPVVALGGRPYLEKLSTPTTSWPRSSSSAMR